MSKVSEISRGLTDWRLTPFLAAGVGTIISLAFCGLFFLKDFSHHLPEVHSPNEATAEQFIYVFYGVPLLVLIAGLIATTAVTLWLRGMQIERSRIRTLVEERSRHLLELNKQIAEEANVIKLNQMALSRISAVMVSFGNDSEKNLKDIVALFAELSGAKGAAYTVLDDQGFTTKVMHGDGPDFSVVLDSGEFLENQNQLFREGLFVFRVHTSLKGNFVLGKAIHLSNRRLGYLTGIVDREPHLDAFRSEILNIIALAVRQEEQRHEALQTLHLHDRALDAAPVGFMITDPNKTDNPIIYVNQVCCLITGYTTEELLGKNCRLLQGEDRQQEQVKEMAQAINDRKPCRVILRNYRKNGEMFWNEVFISPVFNAQGNLSHFVSAVSDITDRIALENQLQHVRRLEAVGQLAAGIAHEINSPAQFILTNVKYLSSSFQKLLPIVEKALQEPTFVPCDEEQKNKMKRSIEEIPQALTQSLEGLERVSHIVKAVRVFAHPSQDEMTAADLNLLIQSTTVLCRSEWKYTADIELDLDPHIPPIMCHPADINQVILNLIVNAAHAIAERNKQETTNSAANHTKGKIEVRSQLSDSEVRILVKDNGMGIPEEIHSKVFHPAFTTKSIGQGTGHGLSFCRQVIVEDHGGDIHFESSVGRGTTFIVSLPLQKSH